MATRLASVRSVMMPFHTVVLMSFRVCAVALRKSRDVLMEQNKALNDMLEEAGKEKELDDNNRCTDKRRVGSLNYPFRYLKGVPIDGKDDGEEDLRAKDLRRRELLVSPDCL